VVLVAQAPKITQVKEVIAHGDPRNRIYNVVYIGSEPQAPDAVLYVGTKRVTG
jgi:hypothetical protein